MAKGVTAAIRSNLLAQAQALVEEGLDIEGGAKRMMAECGITRDRARHYMAKAIRIRRGQEIKRHGQE